MILIVFCHNSLLNIDLDTGEYLPHRRYIYMFHVTCFFLLPILYGYNGIYKKGMRNIWLDVKKGFVSCWIPYTWLFVLFVLYGIYQYRDFAETQLLYSYIIGTQSPMAWILGVHFLWFLPSMFALLFWKSVWYNSNQIIQWVIIIMGVFLFVQDAFRPFNALNIWDSVPFSLMQGIKYLVIALIVRFFLEHFTICQGLIASLSFMLLLTVWFILDEKVPDIEKYTQVTIRMWLMPITVFPLLYYLKHLWIKSRILLFVGKYSLFIYVFHVFVYNIINPLALFVFEQSYLLGFLTFILTLILSCYCSYLLDKTIYLKKILFPKI